MTGGSAVCDSATHLSAFIPALEAAYRVGGRVVDALTSNWHRYATQLPDPSQLPYASQLPEPAPRPQPQPWP
jgi:hypothetical protein